MKKRLGVLLDVESERWQLMDHDGARKRKFRADVTRPDFRSGKVGLGTQACESLDKLKRG